MAKQDKTTRGRSQDSKRVAGSELREVKHETMKTKTSPLKIPMTYEEAMKKALNTPLPKKEKQVKKAK